jgi:hypothetical protein
MKWVGLSQWEGSRRSWAHWALALSLVSLMGCASPVPPRDAAADASIKTVAVVSMLRDDPEIRKIGLTVFGNDQRTLGEPGVFGPLAVRAIESRLRTARPGWTVVPSNANSTDLATKLQHPSFGGGISSVKQDLIDISKRTGADALLVIAEYENSNIPGRGVGAVVLAPPGLAPKLRIHANLSLLLVDKQGEAIIGRRGGDAGVSQQLASELGLSADLTLLDDPDKRARLAAALKSKMLAALETAGSAMGY